MSVAEVNLLNIVLMGLSAAVAWSHPVETFLFVYGFLGPLHYLTEISWLHDKKWFAHGRRFWIAPSIAAVAAAALYAWSNHVAPAERAAALAEGRAMRPLTPTAPFFGTTLNVTELLLVGIVAATVAAAFVRNGARRLWIAAAGLGVGLLLWPMQPWRLFLIYFLSTFVHVFLFTNCFMLYGSQKSRSLTGYAAWAVHLGLGALLLFNGDDGFGALPERATYEKLGSFDGLAMVTARSLGFPTDPGPKLLASLVAVLRFMAFAYTYHYLNWFSKTGIIRWHEMPRRRLGVILATWIASAALYAWDWQKGFIALLALSLAHVYLEFPLNWRTFVGIAQEFRARATSRAAPRTGGVVATPAVD
ncbi:MAG TPA: hypothetical protein VEI02_00020 [Planctomycetota bacterium]|nr:hypothetical protein [Planctomycetota bacterium]